MPHLCAACGTPFVPQPHIRTQKYCPEPSCQRERRRRKQAEKRASNPERRASDAQYFRDWADKHPDYWKQYRLGHPEYSERNRTQQRRRNETRDKSMIANEAVCPPPCPPSGHYRLTPVIGNVIANEDVWIVEIAVLSGPAGIFSGNKQGDCK